MEEEEIDLNDRNGGETSSSSSSRTTKISAKDLEVVKQCARKIIESTRKEGFKGEGRLAVAFSWTRRIAKQKKMFEERF